MLKVVVLFAALYLAYADNRFKRAEEKSVWNTLFKPDTNYDARVGPQPRKDHPVEVSVTMYFLDISQVNDRDGEYTAQFYLRKQWVDPRLHFDNTNVSYKFLSSKDLEKIWTPDLFFVEEKEGNMHMVTVPNSFTRIFPSGKVFNSVRYSVTFACNMDLRNFPHDTNVCEFSIESYAYTARHIKLRWADSSYTGYTPVSMTETPNLVDFTVSGLTYGETSVNMSTGEYSRLQLKLTFQRNSGFYLRSLYLPYILLVIIAWLSFWIQLKFTALRLSLLLVVLGIMFYLSFSANLDIPSVPYTKAVDLWTGFCISLVFAAFLEFVFISQYVKLERKKEKQRSEAEANLVDTEAQKKEDTVPEKLIKFSKIVLPRMHKEDTGPVTVDLYFRYLFPLLFSLFNLIYWCVYVS